MSVLFFKVMHPDARILAFEPNNEAYALLTQNISQNNLQNISIHKKAVSAVEGVVDFFIPNRDTINGSTYNTYSIVHVEQIESVKLSNYITQPIDFMKMDIEGSEHVVIKELIESGKISLINQCIVEYHHTAGVSIDEFIKVLCPSFFNHKVISTNKYHGVLVNALIHFYK